MKINVIVECGELSTQFLIPCGDGRKTIKWLALTASQRFSSRAPHGAPRSRERRQLPTNRSHYLPSNVYTSTKSLGPDLFIVDELEDEEEVIVELAPQVSVCNLGLPELSPWAISAFAKTDHQQRMRLRAQENKTAEEEESNRLREEAERAEKLHQIMEKAAEMKSILEKQLLNEDEMSMEMEEEWNKMTMNGLIDRITEDEEEQIRIRSLIEQNFYALSELFKFYCAVGAGQGTNTMEYYEFTAFIQETGIFNVAQSGDMLHKIFAESVKGGHKGTIQGELHRHEFFAVLIRLARARYSDKFRSRAIKDPLHVTFSKFLQNYILPIVDSTLHGAAIKSALTSNEILALFHDYNLKLVEVFEKYAITVEDNKATGLIMADALNVLEFEKLLMECGVAGRPKGQEKEITPKQIRQAFAGSQSGITHEYKFEEDGKEITIDDDTQMDYPEFLEAISRIALLKWESESMTCFKKIERVLMAVSSLADGPELVPRPDSALPRPGSPLR